MAVYGLYEIRTGSIQEARQLVEKLFSISLQERSSSYYRGPYYAAGQRGHENFELKLNIDPYEAERR
jgi:hypothetical protein